MKRKISLFLAAVLAAGAISAPAYAEGIRVMVNEVQVSFTGGEPVIIASRTMVPLRGVFEQLGYEIYWKADTKTAIITSEKKSTIRVTAGSSMFYKDGRLMYSEVPAQIINGSMYLPLRAVGEAAGLDVAWEAGSKTVYIGEGADKIDEEAAAGIIPTDEEIDALTAEMFTCTVLSDIADGFDGYIKNGHTAAEYIAAVKPFIENETMGLTEEYKQELLDILNGKSQSQNALSVKLADFEEKMDAIEYSKTKRYSQLLDIAGDDYKEKLTNIMEEAVAELDEDEEGEEKTAEEEMDLVCTACKSTLAGISTVPAETKEQQQVKKLFYSTGEIYLDYCLYLLDGGYSEDLVEIMD